MSDPPSNASRVPVFSSSRKWGLRMQGCGPALEDILRQSIAKSSPDQCYTLVEIGSAGCVTLKAFRDIVSEVRGQAPWRVVGFDLSPGKAWSLDMQEVESNGVDRIISDPIKSPPPTWQMSLVLLDNPRLYIQDDFPYPINFAFIDASHGKSCGLDFLALEHKIVSKGVVVFHDYGEAEQGTDWQIVDREFINVRTYVHRLGLASPCNEPRKGWRFVGEVPGSYSKDIEVSDNANWWTRFKDLIMNRRFSVTIPYTQCRGETNSCAIVQRTDEPLEEQPNLSLD